jgi:DNA polymerase-4
MAKPLRRGRLWFETLPVSRFHGVAPKTAEKIQRLCIETGANPRANLLELLEQHFGSLADRFFAIARSQDDRPVNPNRVRKSSGSEATFDRILTEPADVKVN